jgi:hypothetical protein
MSLAKKTRDLAMQMSRLASQKFFMAEDSEGES